MNWSMLRRWWLALMCGGFLLQGGCPTDTEMQKAFSSAGQAVVKDFLTGANGVVTVTVKKWFDYVVGLT